MQPETTTTVIYMAPRQTTIAENPNRLQEAAACYKHAADAVHSSRLSPSAAGTGACRVRYPQHWAPFALMAASAVPHAPFSIALHSMIGVSERTRDVLRTLDVFFILTCGGEGCMLTECQW